jgi:hypothetical protein
VLIVLLWLLLPAVALADGIVFRPIAVAAEVTIPDQRALIHFTNGTERLVIETRFTGEGTNFAWVVPLPSKPVIEEATTGLFPTLQYLFQPQIVHNVTEYYLGILIFAAFVVLLTIAIRIGINLIEFFVILFLFLVFASLLLPMTAGLSKAGSSASAGEEVSVLDRRIVGIFETATIASHDARALQAWLTENGFAVPTNSEPVIASYVKDGWVFVAAKLDRDNPTNATSTPHPLSFTFKAEKPVYPMRLTATASDSLKVDLYVFGPARANATHFNVERCTTPNYPALANAWSLRMPKTLNIVHPLLRQWTYGSPVVTKLTATLSSADMREDVEIKWGPFTEKKNILFSRAGAQTIAWNWASAIFVVTVLCAWIFSLIRKRALNLRKLASVLAIGSLAIAWLIYLSLPKTEVRLLRRPLSDAYRKLSFMQSTLGDPSHSRSAEARELLDEASRDALIEPPQSGQRNQWENVLLGGLIHFEDSPSNFTLRDTTNGLEFVMHDVQGAEYVDNRWRR